MPAAADLLRESYRRLAPGLEAAAGRFFDRLAAESPDLAPLLAAARLRGADREFAQAVAVVARNAGAAEPLGRYLDGLAARAASWGVSADDAAAAREILLEVLAEAAGGEWDTEVESAWAEVLEDAEARLRDWPRGPTGPVKPSPPAGRAGDDRAARPDAGPRRPAERETMLTESYPAAVLDEPARGGADPGVPGMTPAQFYGMVEHAPLTKFFVRPDGVVAYLNAKGHELLGRLAPELGFGPDEFVGGSVNRLYAKLPELKAKAANLIGPTQARVALGGEWLDVYLIPIADAHGRRVGVFQGWDLVTDRVRGDERVREQAANARAVGQVMQSLAGAATVEQAVRAALDGVREAFGWAYGSFWKLDPAARALRFEAESGSVNAEFRQVTERATFAEGVGLSGRAWRQRDLVFVADLAEVSDCVRAPAARRAGVKSGVCFPIVVGGDVFGTMDFFSLAPLTLSDDRTEALRSVGRMVSSSVDSLNAAARYRSMLDGLTINVLLADRQFRITYANPASLKQLRALERHLPIRAEQVIGQSIDVFHKNPSHQRSIAGDPSRLPHRARIALGPEFLDLNVSAVRDAAGEFMGPMVTWAVVTDQVKMADEFETNVKGVVATVASAAAQVQSGSRNMAAVTEQTTRQAQVVAAASEEATRNVQTVSAAAEELTASIGEISRQVQEASRMTTEAVREADRTNGTVKELGEASHQIGQVVKVISSIAQQTNLLALNATIEAARAGEAGKGFAVVANEVKELARQTAKATDEISRKIAAIQDSTGVAVKAIEGIGSRIGRINEIATAVAGAVEEQSAATNEISRNVTEAARGTAEVTQNIGSVSMAADEGGRAAGEMRSAADRLADDAARLGTATDEFLRRVRAM